MVGILAPHLCISCGAMGAVLCDCCIYNISEQRDNCCINCSMVSPRSAAEGVCSGCASRTPYTKAWVGGERSGELKEAINAYKFKRMYAAAPALSLLLEQIIPELPADTQVVAVPTISRHIRQRGYDHAYEVARAFAVHRRLTLVRTLRRAISTQQHGNSRKVRMKQARRAFCAQACSGRFLLVDDVVTTGATLWYAARALRDAGADEVWVAVVARQPSSERLDLLQ